jgi:hypothetical protein
MARSYKYHLVKLNALRNGSQLDLWCSVVRYNLKYLFWRPALVKLFLSDKIQKENKLLYTVLVGDHDQLHEIPKKLPGWDYICFTDNPETTSHTWEIQSLENPLNLDPVRLSRHYKINNHLVDSSYDLSVYVDANFRIRGNLDCFLAHAMVKENSLSMLLHPFHHSLAQEFEACIALGKDDEDILRSQYEYYVDQQGFIDDHPHVAASLIIRETGDPQVVSLMKCWFDQLIKWSRRDQVAFNYARSRCPEVLVNYIPYYILRRYFKKFDHKKIPTR